MVDTRRKKSSAKEPETFFGATTVGEKGQIVIPCDAREAMNLQKGDKLLVFGMGCDIIAFAKLSHLKEFADDLEERLKSVNRMIKKVK